ncbi:MAG: TRAP transporter small permease [Pseudomonadota bacterium]|nr:TRAP transporter small permease [Pseudomonadota bacterium]
MNRPIDRFEAGFNHAMLYLAYLVALSIGLFAVLIPLNLFLIKTHLGSIWWLYEGVEYALYFGVFIGAPWVLNQGAHVRVDVLTAALTRKSARKVERTMDIAGAVLCALLCFYGSRVTIWEFQDGTLPDKDLRIPTGYMMVIFAASFFLLAIEFLLRFRRAGSILDDPDSDKHRSGF